MHAGSHKHKAPQDAQANVVSSSAEADADSSNDKAGQDAELSKIRDLLFGRQVRETEQKQTELETRLSNAIGQLRAEVFQQLEMLVHELRQGLAGLEQGLQRETRARGEQGDALNKRIAEANQTIAQLAEKSEQAQRVLHERIGSESDRIHEELHNLRESSNAQIQDVAHNLRDSKADRHVLAELLTDMSSRLLNNNQSL